MIIIALGTLVIPSSYCLEAAVWGAVAWALGGMDRLSHRLGVLGLLIVAARLGQAMTTCDSLGRLTGCVLLCCCLPHAYLFPMSRKAVMRACLPPLLLGMALAPWLSSTRAGPSVPCALELPDTTGAVAPIAATPRLILLWRDDCRACRQALAYIHALKRAQPQAPLEAINEGQTLLHVVRARHASSLTMRLDAHQQLGALTQVATLPALVIVEAPGQCRVAFQGHDVLSSAAAKKISRVLDEASRANR